MYSALHTFKTERWFIAILQTPENIQIQNIYL